mgnify:FL=1
MNVIIKKHMEIISQNKRICYLIAKQLWEGLDDVERRELEAWRQLEPENEVLYLKLTNREKVSRYVEKRASIDMKKYAMVYDREIGLGVRGRMNKLWGYAAAILVLCVIGVTIWMNELKQNEANQLAQVTIEPGRAKALLVLDDGQEIELDDHKTSKVLEESGIVIVNDSSRVEYRPASRMGEKEVMNKIIVPTGGEYNLILSDGTRVYLNAESVITFPKHFTGERREVTLEGEAYFHVTASKEHPFIVKTKDMDVMVTGTEFNLKAYPDEMNVQTTLLQGVVTVFSGFEKKEKMEIKPNQQAEWCRRSVKMRVREVDPDLFMAWKNGRFIFRQDRLEDIMRTLARWYGVEVVYLDESVKSMLFAGKLDRSEEITPILDVLRTTDKLSVDVKGKKIVIGLK